MQIRTLVRTLIRTPARMAGIAGRRHQELRAHESFTIIYSASGCDHIVDGGRAPGGLGCVHAITSLRAAGSGLPDNSGGDVLSWGGPGGYGVVGDVAAGAAI